MLSFVFKKQISPHRDALEFPDGQIVLLTFLKKGQQATVLQLPASAGVSHPSSVSRHTDEVYGQAQ
jgi:hypothetical protein